MENTSDNYSDSIPTVARSIVYFWGYCEQNFDADEIYRLLHLRDVFERSISYFILNHGGYTFDNAVKHLHIAPLKLDFIRNS